jgi:hypothetical protein
VYPLPVNYLYLIYHRLGLITGGKIADTIGWRWSQYIVAIIDGCVFLLFLFTFEETLFPRNHILSASASVHSASEPELLDTSSDAQSDKSPAKPTTVVSVPVDIDEFPARTYAQKFKVWTIFPQDKTTYWQYLQRPFFLWNFPNVIIVSIPLV